MYENRSPLWKVLQNWINYPWFCKSGYLLLFRHVDLGTVEQAHGKH